MVKSLGLSNFESKISLTKKQLDFMERKKGIKASAGNKGGRTRSDCYLELELKSGGGLDIKIKSKVDAMYGQSNEALLRDILAFYEIKNASIELTDTGALPFVIAARMEVAIKKLINTDKDYLPAFNENNKYSTKADTRRFSRLYLPGNSPSLMLNAGLHAPNGIILDLEDAVALEKKEEARILVRNALRSLDFYGAERMVRINQGERGIHDLDYIIPNNVNLILLPKCEGAEQIEKVNTRIEELKKKHMLDSPVWIMPIIESALGVIKAYEIASAAKNVVALAIGLEDFTADLGTRRTYEGKESYVARCQLVLAAKAAGIQAIDSVFSDVSDMDALKENVLASKALGFDGMGCIHPRQIKVIHENFAPDDAEIDKAKKIVKAFLEAEEKGLGVVSLGTKMIDPPVVKRAQTTISLAISTGKLTKNWMEEEDEEI